jgi:hypothetical protein
MITQVKRTAEEAIDVQHDRIVTCPARIGNDFISLQGDNAMR